MKHSIKLGLVTMAVAALAACGGGGGGGSASSNVTLSGSAAKGILKGAKVAAYEVKNGVQSSTPLQTTTTDGNGNYSFSLAPTTNPVIVVVTTDTNTKMLDESQINLDGTTFKEVAAPTGLSLRTIVTKLDSNTTGVQANPLTEVAVKLAETATKADGTKVPFTPDAIAAGKQIASVITGRDPFTEKPVAKAADMNQMHVLMAGIVANKTTACDEQCQIKTLSEKATVKLDSTNKPTISQADADALKANSDALLNKAKTTLSGTPAANAANNAVANAPTIPTAGYSSANDFAATQGLDAFVAIMRDGFKAAKDQMAASKKDLDARYANLTIASTSAISALSRQINTDCVKTSSFTCTNNTGSGYTWTAVAGATGSYTLSATSNGSTTTATISGNQANGTSNITVTGATIKTIATAAAAAKTTFTADNIQLTAVEGTNTGSLTITGAIKAYDQTSGSTVTETVSLNNVVMSYDKTTAAKPTFSIKGGIDVTGQTGDQLTGTLDLTGYEVQVTTSYPGWPAGTTYTFTNWETFVTAEKINLAAKVNNSDLLGLNVVLSSTPKNNPSAVTSSTNFTKSAVDATLTLTNNVTINLKNSRATWEQDRLETTVTSGTSQITMSRVGKSTTAEQPDQWCNYDGVWLCASTVALTSKGGVYTATLTRDNSGKVIGDIMQGTTKVGRLANNVLTINGKEVSLY